MELQEWEEKHKKFIEKAKSVVKSMDAKNVSLSDVDISVLENRLLKANKEISDLKVCIVNISCIHRKLSFKILKPNYWAVDSGATSGGGGG